MEEVSAPRRRGRGGRGPASPGGVPRRPGGGEAGSSSASRITAALVAPKAATTRSRAAARAGKVRVRRRGGGFGESVRAATKRPFSSSRGWPGKRSRRARRVRRRAGPRRWRAACPAARTARPRRRRRPRRAPCRPARRRCLGADVGLSSDGCAPRESPRPSATGRGPGRSSSRDGRAARPARRPRRSRPRFQSTAARARAGRKAWATDPPGRAIANRPVRRRPLTARSQALTSAHPRARARSISTSAATGGTLPSRGRRPRVTPSGDEGP